RFRSARGCRDLAGCGRLAVDRPPSGSDHPLLRRPLAPRGAVVSVVDPSGAELCLRAVQQRGPSVLAQPLVQRALRAAIERGDPSVDQGLFDVLGKHGLVGEQAIRAVNEYVTWHPAKEIKQDLSPARKNGLLRDSESTAKGS